MSDRRRNVWKKVRSAVISIVIGGAIIWFLLSSIDPRSVPRAIGRIPLWSLAFAFLLYAASIFFKAVRFKIILRSGIRLRHLFPIISLYTFLANILPMRTGDISYIYLLKRRTQTPGVKSLASLVVGAVADMVLIFVGILFVGYLLGDVLKEGVSYFLTALKNTAAELAHRAEGNVIPILAVIILLAGGIAALLILRRRDTKRRSFIWRHAENARSKIMEVVRELSSVKFDARLLGIVIFSILILSFRFGAQCYLVRAMGIGIGIWEINFALLFGLLFSLLPIHGPAGLGTVEAPWVVILCILGVSKEDAITSGFSLHIIVIIYSIVMGIYGTIGLRILRYVQNRSSNTG